LPAAEHVAQETQQAAAQVPQQAVGEAQHGELEVEYVQISLLFFHKDVQKTRNSKYLES